ncbi:uncharacterized protein LOC131627165 [Vicia villosa]|uniref:uncharacterized protein LOC131627165 n=1 Tax=Vicia villosa TaxID=3911 RepID=UPI00273BAFCF|nr:uncharacterized protein LOC131627165 [Vicia villosa]
MRETTNRAGAVARADDEAQASELRVGRLPPIGSNRKQRNEQQAVAGFCVPRHWTGRVSTTVEEPVAEDQVAKEQVVDEPVVQVVVEPVVQEVQQTVVQDQVVQERVVQDIDTTTCPSTEPSVRTDGGFPGGPSERSVLTRYADHVAYRIWHGEVASHGSKLKNFPESRMPEQVRRIVEDFHLMDFTGCSLTMLDASLLSAFVERRHPKTSSFHLPFGEMTVTLDDVDALFHIPIAGTFFTPVYRD